MLVSDSGLVFWATLHYGLLWKMVR